MCERVRIERPWEVVWEAVLSNWLSDLSYPIKEHGLSHGLPRPHKFVRESVKMMKFLTFDSNGTSVFFESDVLKTQVCYFIYFRNRIAECEIKAKIYNNIYIQYNNIYDKNIYRRLY